jgi:7-cyano-7-deazaguanine synthase
VGLLFSGGLDSSILLASLLDEGCQVQPFYVRSNLIWEAEELCAVGKFLAAVARPRLEKLVVLELPLTDLYRNHWSLTGQQPPDAATAPEAVYLPGRNALLVIKAALWCQLNGVGQLALGVLQSNPFADATPQFFRALQTALNCSPARQVGIIRPFARLSKREVMERGRRLPLELTFSCIAPSAGLHCGRCNKCAERQAAFELIGLRDPTQYGISAG